MRLMNAVWRRLDAGAGAGQLPPARQPGRKREHAYVLPCVGEAVGAPVACHGRAHVGTAYTWDRFAEFHRAVTTAASDALRRTVGGGLVSCRFTHVYPDGAAPYYTFIGPNRAGDELAIWREVKAAVSSIRPMNAVWRRLDAGAGAGQLPPRASARPET
jgi:hypothetical protein